MQTRRWVNQSQPQTLYIATFLLYVNAAMLALFGGLFSLVGLVLIALGVGGGYGIANERKLGYAAGLAAAAAPFVFNLLLHGNPLAGDPISIMFDIALVALLLHPMSREYQRIWFK